MSQRRPSAGYSGAHALWEALVGAGVEVVFGYPGGAILPAYDAMLEYPVRHILVRHEQAAAHMADGYARASGRVGVALATSGPGATNLVTGIATAMMDSSPLLCITGQVPSHLIGRDAFQETDITGITLPITKHSSLVSQAEEVGPAIEEAVEIALEGRPGPVLVDITRDAQLGEAPREWTRRRPTARTVADPDMAALEEAARLINECRRPLILAGRGVLLSGAARLLAKLAELGDMPVAMTLLGLGAFPASHPLSLGMMGMHGEAWVNQAIQRADLLVALGMRFDDRVTGNLKTYARNARKIHADIDASEINKNVPVEVALVGDLAGTLERLIPLTRKKTRDAWREEIGKLRGAASRHDIQRMPEAGRLYGAHVIHDLWRLTAGEALVVTDVGQHQMWEAQYYRHESPRQLITSGGLGTMGFALPAALGAWVARPEEEIWVIAGDGGFQMSAAELATCAQEEADLKIAVINNGYLGMVRQWQEHFHGGRYSGTPLAGPDFVRLAEAHGLKGLRVCSRSEVEPAVARARRTKGTVVIDFQVENEESVYPLVPSGSSLEEMIRRPLDHRGERKEKEP